MSIPANSPLRSAPLIKGKIYKEIDTQKCVGRFNQMQRMAVGNGPAGEYYMFDRWDENNAIFTPESFGSAYLTRSNSNARKNGRYENIKHNLTEANEGECGRPFEARAAAGPTSGGRNRRYSKSRRNKNKNRKNKSRRNKH
jgi:hypothetical protein